MYMVNKQEHQKNGRHGAPFLYQRSRPPSPIIVNNEKTTTKLLNFNGLDKRRRNTVENFTEIRKIEADAFSSGYEVPRFPKTPSMCVCYPEGASSHLCSVVRQSLGLSEDRANGDASRMISVNEIGGTWEITTEELPAGLALRGVSWSCAASSTICKFPRRCTIRQLPADLRGSHPVHLSGIILERRCLHKGHTTRPIPRGVWGVCPI